MTTKIILNNTEYNIDESALDSSKTVLQSHLSTVMNGTGATLSLGGVVYNVDSTKLATTRNNFISHLERIAGNGTEVVVNGIEYTIDSAKIASAMSTLENTFSELESGAIDGVAYIVVPSEDALPSNVEDGTIAIVDVGGHSYLFITVSSEDELPTDAVDGTIAIVEASGESAEYSVTISLTNPVHSSSFKNCYIYDDHTANGSPIGEITSATGSTTVKTATGKLLVRLVGSFTSLDGTCTATDGVTFVAETSGGDTGSRHFTFNVDADGAITIDMFDYND